MADFNPLRHPMCMADPLRLVSTGWAGHVPFAMFIVDLLRPRTIVELGTYTGVSYCAFCQAVKELCADARCFAIDTWKGDEQTGFYGAEVLEELRAYHDPLYGDFSSLVESSFDEALSRFEDGTVDLLHVDGYHSYEAVKHDYESWLPKMSERGVLLFHDTQVCDAGFGSREFWAEVSQSYPHFEFRHEHGLGVLAVGASLNEELRQLLEASEDEAALIREFFHQLGERLTVRVKMQQEKEALASQMKEALASQMKAEGLRHEAERQKYEEELLRLEAERRREREALSSLLADRDKRLKEILNSRAWRWVTRYGRVKNRFFVPAYSKLRPSKD